MEGLRNLGQAIVNATDLTADEIARSVVVLGEASAEALARGNQGIADELSAMQETMRGRAPAIAAAAAAIYDPLSSIAVNVKQAVVEPIRGAFQVATAEIAAGFGSVKAALQKGSKPQLISKDDRLENMQARIRKVMRNIKAAVKADDPWNVAYWEQARAKQQMQMEKLRGANSVNLKDIKRAYRSTGADVKGVWQSVRVKTVQETQSAADGALTAIGSIETGIQAIDLTDDAMNLGLEVAAGLDSSVPSVAAAASRVAAAAAGPIESHSPPKFGPLAHIDEWGANLVDTWLKPMEARVGHVGRVGAKLAGALAPRAQLAGMAMATAGAGQAGGNHYHVGTLIANDAGLDEFDRRIERRRKIRGRGPMRYADRD